MILSLSLFTFERLAPEMLFIELQLRPPEKLRQVIDVGIHGVQVALLPRQARGKLLMSAKPMAPLDEKKTLFVAQK